MSWIIVFIFTAWLLAYYKVTLITTNLTLVVLVGVYYLVNGAGFTSYMLVGLSGVALVVCNLTPLRRRLIAEPVFKMMKEELPPMSQTEREALEAGDT